MVRSDVRPSNRSRSGPSGPRSTTAERSGAHTSAVTRSCTTRCATSAASSSLSAACSWSTPAGSLTSPAPSAYHRCCRTRSRQLLHAPGLGRPGCRVRGLQHPSARSGRWPPARRVGGRTGLTRPTSVRARSDHSKTIAGSPCSRASLMSLPGQVAAVSDEGALQVEAPERGLPGVQVGETGPDVVRVRAGNPRARGPARHAPRARAAAWSPAWRRRRARHPAAASRRRARPRDHAHPGPLELQHGGIAARVRARAARRPAGPPARAAIGDLPPTAISATRATVSARSAARRTGLAAEPTGRAASDHARLRRVLAEQRPGQGRARTRPGRCAAGATRRPLAACCRARAASRGRPAAVRISARSCSTVARLIADDGEEHLGGLGDLRAWRRSGRRGGARE